MNTPEGITDLVRTINIEHGIAVTGLLLLAVWLLTTGFGTRALVRSRRRRNDMPLYIPFLLLFAWFGPVQIAILVARTLAGDLAAWQQEAITNFTYSAFALLISFLVILFARRHFEFGLKGFGLNASTVPKDLCIGFADLLAVWPLIMGAMLLTIVIGKVVLGDDFEMRKHKELELVAEHSEFFLRISVVFVAAVIAPLLEELIFRGMLQTVIRSLVLRRTKMFTRDMMRPHIVDFSQTRKFYTSGSAWLAISITSVLFAIVHANPGHWPALFILSMCLGYSYEKCGSLLRPIFIHSIFNTVTVVAALYE